MGSAAPSLAGHLQVSVGQYSDKGRAEINQDFHGIFKSRAAYIFQPGTFLAGCFLCSSANGFNTSCQVNRRVRKGKGLKTKAVIGKAFACFSIPVRVQANLLRQINKLNPNGYSPQPAKLVTCRHQTVMDISRCPPICKDFGESAQASAIFNNTPP